MSQWHVNGTSVDCHWALWTTGQNLQTPRDIARALPAVPPRLLSVTSKKSQWYLTTAVPAAFSVYIFSKESMCTRCRTRCGRTRRYSQELFPVWTERPVQDSGWTVLFDWQSLGSHDVPLVQCGWILTLPTGRMSAKLVKMAGGGS